MPLDGRLTDPEILEFRYPLVIEDFGIRQGSGGDGKFKGGNGISRKIKFTEEMTVSMLANHRKVPPPPFFFWPFHGESLSIASRCRYRLLASRAASQEQ